jgi:hypothetical protein
MDYTSLIGPAVVAGVISSVVVGIGILISARMIKAIHGERLAFDREQSERRVSAEIALAERQASAEIALAERKVALDRAHAVGQRRTEFAEQVLADFYQARDIIKVARSPGSFAHEGGTRPKADAETDRDTLTLNAYFAPTERLMNKGEFFAQLHARRYRFTALFGSDAAKPYDDLFTIRSVIISAVQMLIMTYPNRYQGSLDSDRSEWEGIIWEGRNAADTIPGTLDRVVEAIEKTCRQAIQEATK